MSRQLGQFLNFSINFVLSLIITVAVGLMLGSVTWQAVVLGTLVGFLVGYVFADLVPVMAIGDGTAAKLRTSGVAAFVVSCAVLALIMATVISVLTFLITLGFTEAFVTTWWSVYPRVVGIAFVVLLVVRKPLVDLGLKLFAPEPAAVPVGSAA